MKTLLVNPSQRGRHRDPSMQMGKNCRVRYPAGLYMVAAALAAHGFQAPIVDLEVEDAPLEPFLRQYEPDIVGITSATANRFEAIDVAQRTRAALPATPIAVGGPHFTFTADDALRNIPEIDIVVRGEGEVTMREIMQALADGRDLADVAGISFRSNGQVVHNPDRVPVRDLDELPSVDWQSVPWEKYDFRFMNLPCVSMMTGRGCPVNCTFCSTTKMWGKHLRWRSPERVVDDIEQLVHEHGFEAIFFDDDAFTLNPRHFHGILDEIERRQLTFRWICQTRVDAVNRDILAAMKHAGCYYIYFGVETGSPKMLNAIHKCITKDQVIQTIKDCLAVGILCHALFMYSLPGETDEDRRMTVELMQELIGYGLDAFSASPTLIYPGTEVETIAFERGVLPADFSWSKPYCDPQVQAAMPWLAHTPLYLETMTLDELIHMKQQLDVLHQPLRSARRLRSTGAYRQVPRFFRGLADVRSKEDLQAQLSKGRNTLSGAARLVRKRLTPVE